jgi:DNA repair exonuclease SbcCD ATPase subunit
MKKILPIAGVAALALMAFLGSMFVLVRLRGGAAPGSALAAVPGLAADPTEADAEAPVEGESPVAPAAERDMSFLRQGSVLRLNEMADTLSKKQAEYEQRERRLKQKEQQLQAMQEQLSRERDALRKRLLEQKKALEEEAIRVQQERAELKAEQESFRQKVLTHHTRLAAAEKENLQQLAQSIGRMKPDTAAELLLELHAETTDDAAHSDTVVKVMYLMESRLCARVFDAMVQQGEPGRQLAATVAQKLKTLTKESPQGG